MFEHGITIKRNAHNNMRRYVTYDIKHLQFYIFKISMIFLNIEIK